MKLRLYKNFGALNSPAIFSAFEEGAKRLGHTIVDSNEDVAVIWSVLWHGRMIGNQKIYQDCIARGKPVIIIEVGNLKRGITWRISEGHINNLGTFGNNDLLDEKRPEKLGIFLQPEKLNRRPEILIATQHSQSLQWQGQLPMDVWVKDVIYRVKQYTDRKIVVRPHPRSIFRIDVPNIEISRPVKIPNSYDDFDIDYNFHCVINHNSGPAVQAAIQGTPVVCDPSSLAFSVSEKWENLENPQLPDRRDWFLKLCHTEWTVEEIAQGIPLQRLTNSLQEKLAIRA